MTALRTLSRGLVVAGFACVLASTASAQSSRTWVSGTGDDVNPCSRTAPCRTFAGAIPKTILGGEINAIDSGAYGTFSVSKSITIDGHDIEAGVFGSGDGTAITISAFASTVVILRNLDLNGLSSGATGIRIIQARDVYIENCRIYGFTGRGISDERSAGGLYVSDSTIADNGQTGINVAPAGALSGTLHATLTNVRLQRNGNAGLAVSKGAKATVTHSVASGNISFGFYADGNGGVSELNLSHSLSAANGQGLASLNGGVMRIAEMVVTANGIGVNTAGGSLLSYGNNRIDGNGSNNGPPTGSLFDQ
jgi:parallel beta helix pectate lyase-like protein